VLEYGEKLPDHKTQACTEEFAKSAPVLHRLACIAKQNQMYIAANTVDVQPCHQNVSNKVPCPPDHINAFNTADLLVRDGYFLAKYHKMHLFGEREKNVPPTKEFVVVDTEIGRLGMQVCFDMIFATPGHELARKHMIDTLLFPTLWFNEAPFLSASQYQMSWS